MVAFANEKCERSQKPTNEPFFVSLVVLLMQENYFQKTRIHTSNQHTTKKHDNHRTQVNQTELNPSFIIHGSVRIC